MTETLTHGLEITEAAKAELRRHIESADVSDLAEGGEASTSSRGKSGRVCRIPVFAFRFNSRIARR